MSSPPTTQASRSINYSSTAELLAELSNGFRGDRPRSELFVAEFLRDLHHGEYPSILVRRGDNTLRPLSALLPNLLPFGEGSIYQKILQDLEWFQGAEVELKYVFGTGYEGADSQLDLHFDLAWLDLKVNTTRPIRVAPTALRELRDQIVTALSVARTSASRATIEERCVLLVTIDGAAYKVPDLTVLGPSKQQSEQSDDDSLTINIVHLPLSEIATKGAQKEDFANELNNALGALARSGEGWKEAFKYSLATLTEVRTQFRRKLQGHLQDTMALFEETRQQEAADDELGVLRQAASFIAFRMMFLLELERRGRLYRRGPAVATLGTEQITRTLADELAYRSDELWDTNAGPKGALLARLTHSSRAIRSDIKDPHMAITGASIFANNPPNFDPRIEDWLNAVEALVDDGQDKDLLYKWDLQLQRLGSVMLGHLDDEYRSELNLIGSGAHRHRHRVLGTIYEQILAMMPKRDKTGTIRLVVGKTKGEKKDDRSALGAHYTPAALVEEVVRPTLGQLFRQFWEQAQENPQKYAKLIREMTLVDPAMGSAHFLTVSALEIARELAWIEIFNEPRFITLGSEEKPWDEPLLHKNAIGPDPEPKEGEEQERQDDIFYGDQETAAKFEKTVQTELPGVIQRSIYGVDINPLAAELGKLSLWLFEVQERAEDQVDEFPELTYLDSNIRVGDALVGVMLEDVEETVKNAQRTESAQQTLFGLQKQKSSIEEELEKLSQLRQAFRTTPESPEDFEIWARGALDKMLLQDLDIDGVTSTYERHSKLDHLLRKKLQDLSWLFDLTLVIKYVGYTSGSGAARRRDIYKALFASDAPNKGSTKEDRPAIEEAFQILFEDPTSDDALDYQQNLKDWIEAQEVLNVFHWELQFPHIFNKKDGFDAIVANPPFIGDRDLRARLKSETLVKFLADYFIPQKKVSDYAGFFFWRYDQITSSTGVVGSLASNSIAQASNREYVTKPLTVGEEPKFTIFRALPNREWPGEAAVHFSATYFARQFDRRARIVRAKTGESKDQETASFVEHDGGISSYLDEYPDLDLKSLLSLTPTLYQGFILRGNFSIHREPGQSPFEAIENIPENERDALRAYLNAHSIQQRPRPTPADVVIDFFDPLQRAGLDKADALTQLGWLEENYPETLRQLRERSPHAPEQESVYEQRMKLSDSGSDTPHKTFWWLYGSVRQGLRADWRDVDTVIAFPRVIKVWSPFRLNKSIPLNVDTYPLDICPMDMVFVAARFSSSHFTVVSSFLCEMFTRRACSTLGTGLRFTPTEVFPYFPWPWLPKFDGPRLTIGEPPQEMAESLSKAAENLLNIRTSILEHPNEHGLNRAQVGGPTDLYNLYDSDPDGENPREGAENSSIEALRQAHVDLFDAVLRAYGWEDLAERCTRQDWVFDHPWLDRTMRFVPPEPIRAELFQRINDLNAERYELEREMIISFIVENLPDQGLTKTSFGETAPFSEMNITSDQFAEFMQWELDERQETSRVRKDGHYWKKA